MRKLAKAIEWAIEYQDWYGNKPQRVYNSSANKYYYDVLYELLLIQGGICAYTEYRLISKDHLETLKAGFENGKYASGFHPDVPADIEHFDKKLKQGNGWDWSNLFAVEKFTNMKKNHLEDVHGIDEILKPDHPEFAPFRLLRYNKSEHCFEANKEKISEEEAIRVSKMLIVLGVNNDFIKMKRREFLEEMLDYLEFRPEKIDIHQFPTAYAMLTAQNSSPAR